MRAARRARGGERVGGGGSSVHPPWHCKVISCNLNLRKIRKRLWFPCEMMCAPRDYNNKLSWKAGRGEEWERGSRGVTGVASGQNWNCSALLGATKREKRRFNKDLSWFDLLPDPQYNLFHPPTRVNLLKYHFECKLLDNTLHNTTLLWHGHLECQYKFNFKWSLLQQVTDNNWLMYEEMYKDRCLNTLCNWKLAKILEDFATNQSLYVS